MFIVNQAAHGFSAGDWLYQVSAGVYDKAKADTAPHAKVVGVVDAVLTSASFRLAEFGDRVTLAATLVPGATYYVSGATAGVITATAPPIRSPALVAVAAHVGEVVCNGSGAVGSGAADVALADITDISAAGIAVASAADAAAQR